MAVRIYSLAKELKLDSKVLVDICTNAGVTGKGSALASLTEEEVDRVKAYMAGGASSGARPAAPKRPAAAAPTATTVEAPTASGALRREDYLAPGGTAADKIPVLGGDKMPRAGKSPRTANRRNHLVRRLRRASSWPRCRSPSNL